MTPLRRLFLLTALATLASAPAFADAAATPLFAARSRVWEHVYFQPPADAPRLADAAAAAVQTAPPPKLAAVEYSDAYKTRAKIHRYASFAMLPLVGTELFLGNSLYNTPTDTKKSAHIAVGTGIMALFGVNTVTGVWNMWEARKDTNGRTRRMIHGILMMAADAGFLATAASGPGREREFEDAFTGGNSRGTHRAIAITSLATATAGYLVMIIGGR